MNAAAFVDKAAFSVWATRRKREPVTLKLGPNFAVGGQNRGYARSLHGINRMTGSPFELKYGRLQKWKRFPPFRLTLRSADNPLSGAQVRSVLDALFHKGYRCKTALVELTFDLSAYSFSLLSQRLFTTARSINELVDCSGRKTLYVGTPRSPLQLRIYEKTDGCVRVEFVLRPAYLRAHRIVTVEHLLKLRAVDLWKAVWFQAFRRRLLATLIQKGQPFWGSSLFRPNSYRWPFRLLADVLRFRARINPARYLRRCELQRVLMQMQEMLIW